MYFCPQIRIPYWVPLLDEDMKKRIPLLSGALITLALVKISAQEIATKSPNNLPTDSLDLRKIEHPLAPQEMDSTASSEGLSYTTYIEDLMRADSLSAQMEKATLSQVRQPIAKFSGKVASQLPLMLLLPVVNPDGVIPSLFFKIKAPASNSLVLEAPWGDASSYISDEWEVSNIFKTLLFDDWMLHHMAQTHPQLLKRSASDLLGYRVVSRTVGANNIYVSTPNGAANIPAIAEIDAPPSIPMETKYWFHGFESTIQFSQNHISENWHKGGASNINLFSRQLFRLDYRRDKLNWANELEWRIVMLSTIQNTIANYKISEDVARLRSNLGYKAVKNWFYSLDAEVRTQLFSIRSEDQQTLYSSLFAPVTFTIGLGMKYQIDKKFERHYGRRFRFNANLAPFAYDYKWTRSMEIDMQRHGLDPNKPYYSAMGSMMRADMIFDISPMISWESKFYYNTSYKRVETEWENGISFAFNKYFSSRILLMLRFDDATPKASHRFGRLQYNELFSFGFDLKL